MTRFVPFVLWVVLATSSVGCSGLAKVDVGRVLSSGRDGWQHPERVVEALSIEPGHRVAEIGAGRGYWLEMLSDAVGPTGRVYAIEVDEKLAAMLRQRIEENGLANVEVILASTDDPRLPDASIDLAMTSLTYHHIEDRVRYFERLEAHLAPGGRVAHLDDRPDSPPPISWFQTPGHSSFPEEIEQEMTEAGYRLVASFDFLPAQSFQVFAPGDGSSIADPMNEAALEAVASIPEVR